MPFMRVNGITVPVADGGIEETQLDNPSGLRSFAGGYRSFRRAPKRSWRVTTTRMSQRSASILEATLLGQPEVFPYDNSVYGVRGTRPLPTPTPRVGFRPRVAADGLPVLGHGMFGSHGISLSPATTNLLAANQRNVETGVVGFTALDAAALTQDPTFRYQGLFSLRVITSAAVNGIRGGVFTTGIAVAATGMRGSVYVMSPTAASVRAYLRNTTLAVDGPIVTVTLTPNTWQRLGPLSQAAGTAVGHVHELHVEEGTIDSGITFYIDALQIQTGNLMTEWADPSYLNNGLRYGMREFQNADAITINYWCFGQPNATGATVHYADSADLTRNRILATNSGTTSLILDVRDEANRNVVFTATAMFVASPTPRMHTIVVRNKLGPGEARVSVYRDGTLAASSSSFIQRLDFGRMNIFDFFNNGGASWMNDVVGDHLAVLPWAMTTAEIAALYAAASPLRGAYLTVDGDFIPESSIVCLANLAPSRYQTFQAGTAYESAGRAVSFVLEEL